MSEPTNGEVMRRLDDVSRQLAEVARQLAEDRAQSALLYVRKDVQEQIDGGIHKRLDTIERERDDEQKTAAATRRQMMFLILGIAIPAIAGLLLAVNNFLAAGGGVTP